MIDKLPEPKDCQKGECSSKAVYNVQGIALCAKHAEECVRTDPYILLDVLVHMTNLVRRLQNQLERD